MNPALVSLAPALPLWWRMARALVVAGFAALCFAAGWAAEGWRKRSEERRVGKEC